MRLSQSNERGGLVDKFRVVATIEALAKGVDVEARKPALQIQLMTGWESEAIRSLVREATVAGMQRLVEQRRHSGRHASLPRLGGDSRFD